jgi:OOP family OmpA-OmpF porin
MKTNFQKSIMLLGAIAISNFALAQDKTPKMSETPAPFTKGAYRTWSLGLNGGVMAPVVAIGGRNDFTNWQASLGYGGYIKKQIWHNFGIQADFYRGILKANNDKTLGNGTNLISPYTSYKTKVNWVGTLSAVYNIGNFSILDRQSYVSPYVSAGAGLTGYQPTDITTGGQSVTLKNGKDIHEFVVPVGVGAKFLIAKGVNLDLGYKMNFVDGDNLDGYHKEPQNDKFSYGYAGLEFALGNKLKSQLAFTNPAAALEKDYVAKYDDLKAQMANMPKNNEDEVNALKDKVNKLMTDSDGDGVSDYYDKCPDTPKGTAVDGSGCPLPKVELVKPVTYIITDADKKIVKEAIKNLEFDFNKSTIRSKSYETLNRVAELLISKNLSLKLAGHTDSRGSEMYNMKLSKERAESVKTYLVSKMVNPSRIEATGYGETQPIDTNATAAGRQNNRRVEFTLFN